MLRDFWLDTKWELSPRPTRGETVKKGAEAIGGFTGHGMFEGTAITPKNQGNSRFICR